jgi:hypothetical protein
MPGLAICIGVLGAAVAALNFGQLGMVHGHAARIYLTASRARGIIPGTEVWLDGISVGAVRWVHFQPPTPDTASRLLLALDVIDDARRRIRRDTRVEIRAAAGEIGSPVIVLTGGSRDAPSVADGDTMATAAQDRLAGTREQLAVVAQSLPVVLDNINSVHDQIFSRSGTIGALTNGPDTRPLRLLRGRAVRLGGDTASSHGTVALIANGGLSAHVHQTLDRADSLVRVASGPTGALRQLRPDTGLPRAVAQVDQQLAALGAQIAKSAKPDSIGSASLQRQIAEARARLRALTSDVTRRPLRYVNF